MQGCPDSNGDGYSDSYGSIRSQLALMGSNPSASLLTFAWPLFGFLITLFTLRMGNQKEDVLAEIEDDLLEEGGEF